MGELEKVLDVLAPPRRVLVKERSLPLNLSEGTRRLMRERDASARCKSWELYRRLRNLTARRVRRQDRLHSNRGFLQSCSSDPGKLWRMADDLTGRSRIGGLPPELKGGDGPVCGDEGLAEELNRHYISKIQCIREDIEQERQAQPQHSLHQQQQQYRAWPDPGDKLILSSPSETAVLRVISNLKRTPALGEDGVPVQVLKDLAPVLAALAAAHGAWHQARTLGRTLAVAAYDFSSAFDTLEVVELTRKLDKLDLGDELISWVRDYLRGGDRG